MNKKKYGGKRKTKKVKRKSSKKSKKSKCSKVDSGKKMKDANLTALCMKCFHKNGRKNGVKKMSLKNRCLIVNKRGRKMVKGKCVVCSGNMFTFV